MKRRTNITCIALTALAGVALASGTSLAQERDEAREDHLKQAPRDAGPQMEQGARPLLGGPRVQDDRLPGLETGFSTERSEFTRVAGEMVPPQVFRRLLGELAAEDAALEIRLSGEQRERITAHVRAFEERLSEMRARGGDRRGPGQGEARPGPRTPGERGIGPRRGGGDGMTGEPGPRRTDRRPDRGQPDRGEPGGPAGLPRNPEAPTPQMRGPEGQRARLAREVAGVQQRVWAELSAAQQAHLSRTIEAWRKQADEDRMGRMEDRYRREFSQRFGEMDAKRPERSGAGQSGGGEDLRQWFAGLPEDVQQRVRARLETIPRERRDALVERAQGMTGEQRARLLRRLMRDERPNPDQATPR